MKTRCDYCKEIIDGRENMQMSYNGLWACPNCYEIENTSSQATEELE